MADLEDMPGLDLTADDYECPPHKVPYDMTSMVATAAGHRAAADQDEMAIPEAVGRLKHCPSSLNMRSVTSKR